MKLLHALLLATAAATGACAGAEASTPEEGSRDSDFTGARRGFSNLSSTWGGDKASGIAVREGKAYVGFGARGFAIVDLRTMETTKRARRDEAGALLAADSVRMAGDDLMLAGLRDDAPPDPLRGGSYYNYVVSLVDRTSGAVKKQVVIDVMKALSRRGESLFDLPNMAATVDGNQVWLVVSHDRAKKLVHFELPAARTTSLDLRTLLAEPAITVELAQDLAVHEGAAYLPVPEGRSSGYVRRIDLRSGASSKVGAELGHPVGVALGARAMFVADHSGALLAVDPRSGATLEELEISDFVTGVTSDRDNVYVSTWKGIFVTKNEWR